MLKKIVIALIAVTAISSSAHAVSLGSAVRNSKPATIGTQRAAPVAYQIFCRSNTSECKADTTQKIKYTSETAAILRQVNSTVNSLIAPKDEPKERWQINVSSGDCEDYALTKRSQLIKRGIASGALRMAVVFTENRELHAVLVVRTDKGDFVLDNRRNDIRRKSDAGYIFAMMASNNPLVW